MEGCVAASFSASPRAKAFQKIVMVQGTFKPAFHRLIDCPLNQSSNRVQQDSVCAMTRPKQRNSDLKARLDRILIWGPPVFVVVK